MSNDVEDTQTTNDGKEVSLLGVERRYADDGEAYTFQQFVEYFGDGEAKRIWEHAPRQKQAPNVSKQEDAVGDSEIKRHDSEKQRLEHLEQDMLDNLVSVSAELYTESTRRSQLGLQGGKQLEADVDENSGKIPADVPAHGNDDRQDPVLSSLAHEAQNGSLVGEVVHGTEEIAVSRQTLDSHASRSENSEQIIPEEGCLQADGLHILSEIKQNDLRKHINNEAEIVSVAKRDDKQQERSDNGNLDEDTEKVVGTHDKDEKRNETCANEEVKETSGSAHIELEGKEEENRLIDKMRKELCSGNDAAKEQQTANGKTEGKQEKVKESLRMKKRGSLPIKKEDFRICGAVKVSRPEPLSVDDQQRFKAKQRQVAEEKISKEASLVIATFTEDGRHKEDPGDSFKNSRKWWRGKSSEARARAAGQFGIARRKGIFELLIQIRDRPLYRAQADEMLRDLIVIQEWIADAVVDVRAVNALLNGEEEVEEIGDEVDENMEDVAAVARTDTPENAIKKAKSIRKHRSIVSLEDPEELAEEQSSSGLEQHGGPNGKGRGKNENEMKATASAAHGGLEKKLKEAEATAERKRKIELWCKENGYVDAYTRKKTYRGDSKFALHTAVKQENVEMVKLLLLDGASKDCTNSKNQTPLQLANTLQPGSMRDQIILALREA